jgi:hypothetical protein
MCSSEAHTYPRLRFTITLDVEYEGLGKTRVSLLVAANQPSTTKFEVPLRVTLIAPLRYPAVRATFVASQLRVADRCLLLSCAPRRFQGV